MKRLEAHKRTIGGAVYYIRPFPAMKAAAISGELAAIAAPLLGALLPLAGKAGGGNALDLQIEDAAPAVGDAFNSLSGDKVERLLNKLLIEQRNISYEGENGELSVLTEDDADEIFCGEVQDMYLLAFEVIKINFNGFFKRLGGQFGKAAGALGLTQTK